MQNSECAVARPIRSTPTTSFWVGERACMLQRCAVPIHPYLVMAPCADLYVADADNAVYEIKTARANAKVRDFTDHGAVSTARD
eukprot:31185-Eustigmatos_ZCMA.PRE.1